MRLHRLHRNITTFNTTFCFPPIPTYRNRSSCHFIDWQLPICFMYMFINNQFVIDFRSINTKILYDMEILKLNRRIFISVGLYPLPREAMHYLKYIQNSCSILIGTILILIVWGSGFSLIELIQKGDFEKNAFALIEVMAPIPIFLSFVSLIYRRKNIREFCSKTQQMVDQCNFKKIRLISCSFSHILLLCRWFHPSRHILHASK